MLKNLDKNSRTPLDFVLDLHAHANATGIFVYGNTYDDVYRYFRSFFEGTILTAFIVFLALLAILFPNDTI